MAAENLVQLTDDNFEAEVVNSNVPVLVDFWAEWCAPCHLLTPIISELASEYAGKVKVARFDVDQAPQIAAKYGIRNIPTVLLFDNGEPVESFVGVRRKRDYQATLDAQLGVG
jgi:thioredoxin 1